MRIVVRSALLFALMVALPSIAAAQSRYYSGQPAFSTQQDGSGYSRGYDSGRHVPMPQGWIYENDNGGGADAGTADAGTVEADSDERYGNSAGTVESDGSYDNRYRETAGTVEGGDGGDARYGGTTEGESADGNRYGETAGTVEGEGGYDSPDGDTAETLEGGSDDRYGEAGGGFQEFGSRPASDYRSSRSRYGSTAKARGRIINCYLDRKGRTICP